MASTSSNGRCDKSTDGKTPPHDVVFLTTPHRHTVVLAQVGQTKKKGLVVCLEERLRIARLLICAVLGTHSFEAEELCDELLQQVAVILDISMGEGRGVIEEAVSKFNVCDLNTSQCVINSSTYRHHQPSPTLEDRC